MITEEQRLQMLSLLAPVAFDPEKMDKLIVELEKTKGIKTTPEEIMANINRLRSVRGT